MHLGMNWVTNAPGSPLDVDHETNSLWGFNQTDDGTRSFINFTSALYITNGQTLELPEVRFTSDPDAAPSSIAWVLWADHIAPSFHTGGGNIEGDWSA